MRLELISNRLTIHAGNYRFNGPKTVGKSNTTRYIVQTYPCQEMFNISNDHIGMNSSFKISRISLMDLATFRGLTIFRG